MSRWERIMGWLAESWVGQASSWIASNVRRIFKFILLVFILILVWIGFLALVPTPPLDTTPALIMVWVTAAILLLGLFPSMIQLIKRIKIGNIELELRDSFSTSQPHDFISGMDIGGVSIDAIKGDANNLQTILAQILQRSDKPVLLTVNLTRDISKPFLFVYLLFIEPLARSTIVLFVARGPRFGRLGELRANEIIGVISGKELLRSFYLRFPSLFVGTLSGGTDAGNVLEPSGFVQVPSIFFIQNLFELCRKRISNDLELELNRNRRFEDRANGPLGLLTRREVEVWLKDQLDTHTINASLNQEDLETLRERIIQGDKFIIILQGRHIRSIIELEGVANTISKNVLTQISNQN